MTGERSTITHPSGKELRVDRYRIELRSDTQTVPTAEMREAVARAEVGDEQWGEDPTVLELEARAAEIFGREAAILVPSGTMGNLTSLMALSNRGDTVMVDAVSHMVGEGGSYATVASCNLLPIESGGVLTSNMVRERLATRLSEPAHPAIIWTENTHNVRGGVSSGPEVLHGHVELAAERGFRLHVDGRESSTPRSPRGCRCVISPRAWTRCSSACQRVLGRRSGRWWSDRGRRSHKWPVTRRCLAARCAKRASWRPPG